MFDRLSIRHKLVVLLELSSALALLISSAITIYSTYVNESKASLRVLHQLTHILSENMRAALAFNDSHSANNMLAPLHTDPHILLAVVSDNSGMPLSEYRSAGLSGPTEAIFKERLVRRIKENGSTLSREDGFVDRIETDFMGVVQPIFFDGKPIGTLAVISDTQLMWAKIRGVVQVQIASSLLTLVLLLFLSLKLQSLFTRPIMDLIDAMKEVARTKNYGAVLASKRQDEFGDLHEGFNVMLTEIRERDDRLSKLATTDALTGLANRRHAMETIETMAIRAYRKGEPLGLIMLDIDFFKKVNDRYGHPVGDLVLKEVSRVLQASAREYDLVARLGGEEFLVICDNGTEEVTTSVAERIRQSVENRRIEYQSGQYLNVTVSLGVYSSVPQPNESIELPIKTADEALYRAKESGRNRLVVA